MHNKEINRRKFLEKAGMVSAGVAATLGGSPLGIPPLQATEQSRISLLPNAADLPSRGKPIKLFCCDLNFVARNEPKFSVTPAQAQDWAYLDPKEYFAWHRDFGVNIFFLQGYSWCGLRLLSHQAWPSCAWSRG